MPSSAVRAKGPSADSYPLHSHQTIGRPGNAPVAPGNLAAPLTPVLQNRWLIAVLVLAAMLQAGLAAADLSAWTCPFYHFFSLPCPACGLTTGVVHLLHGQWDAALQAHWLSPLLLAGMAVAGLLAVMPTPIHRRLIKRFYALERRMRVSTWMAVFLGVSWIWRILNGI